MARVIAEQPQPTNAKPARAVSVRAKAPKAALGAPADPVPTPVAKPATPKTVKRRATASKNSAATAPVTTPSITTPAMITPSVITVSAAAAPAVAAPTPNPTQGIQTMTEATNKIEDTVAKAAATTTEKATDMIKDMSARAKSAMDKSGEFAKEAMEFNKLNVEAIVEAGKIAVKGAQTAAQNAAELGRKNIEQTTTMVKSISSVKAPADFFKIQGDFARSQFDTVVAEMSKSSEFYLKLAGEVFQPISTRYSVAADQIKARMAA